MQGFIQLHRQLLEWEWYTDKNVKIAFIHMLLKANFKKTKWKGRTIERGQLIIGTERFGKEIGLTIQEVKTVLKKLKKTKEVTTLATSKFLLVTIVNFDAYQSEYKYEQPGEQPASNQVATSKQPQRNNDNNVNNITYTQNDIYKNPILEDRLTNIASSSEFNERITRSFKDYCHYLNWKDRNKGGWGNLGQITKVVANIKEQLSKYNEDILIKTISEVMERGNFKIDASYYSEKKQKQQKPEQTLTEYYEKHLRAAAFRNLRANKPHIVQDYPKHKDSVLELKLELNCNNETLTTPFLYDVMYGMFTHAGAKPLSRYAVFRTFLNSLTDFKRNKGELRKLFSEYLKRR